MSVRVLDSHSTVYSYLLLISVIHKFVIRDSDKGIRPIIGIRVKFIFECEVENKTCSVLISLGNL